MSSVDTTVASSPTLDPFTQVFTLLLSDGTSFNVSVPDLDAYILYNVDICINYSAQLGASLILLVILVLLTKSEKRRSPIFILNSISLALNTIRNVLQCLYFTGPFSETYAYFAQDYSRVPPSSYATSIAGTVLTLLLLICVELSLILQTRVVCITIRDVYRHCILGCSLTVALLAISFRFALVVENSKYILAAENFTPFAWLGSATNITASISICFFCAVFVTKLGLALNERRKLGLQQFGPMQIIFIMGCQTLVIPAIFSILQYFTDIPEMGSNVLTLVAIFLPLSSIWASSSIDSHHRGSTNPDFPRKLFGSYASGSTGPLVDRKTFNGRLSPAETTNTRISNSSLPSPANAGQHNAYSDLEA
ncbi:MAG: hypothetical protein M1830_002555 [Pleopsidium flavum]|nr:MAG: hypothetical protein M1830_002555 [Pleopsidium flavum]